MVTKNLSNDFMAKVLEDAAWKELSGDFAWNEQLLEKYKNYWNWRELSRNSDQILTSELLEQFADCWDWNEIIDCYGREGLFSAEFLEKYQDRIPASSLQRSRLWDKLVEYEAKRLKVQILS